MRGLSFSSGMLGEGAAEFKPRPESRAQFAMTLLLPAEISAGSLSESETEVRSPKSPGSPPSLEATAQVTTSGSVYLSA